MSKNSKSKKRSGKNHNPKHERRSEHVDTTHENPEVMAELEKVVSALLKRSVSGQNAGLIQGINNIASMAPFNPQQGSPLPVPGMGEMVPGLMAFRRRQQNMNVAFVGGKCPVFYLPLDKLVLAVEHMHDPKRRTVIVQNCSESADDSNARGQILARFNSGHSALHGVWGHKGRVISESIDIAKQAVYYIKREDLLCFYLAAKAQLKGGDLLEETLRANEGWREYDLPTNPLDPGGE